jgi:2-polyprenyl-3-methyl-5-hydroxy-6-metoxy-1,4-benzoquinol methylase
MNKLQLLTIKSDDSEKWIKYYKLETKRYYEKILQFIPVRQNILEIGCGSGLFYKDFEHILTNMNNTYTCIDIDDTIIEHAKKHRLNYVDFLLKDINDITDIGKYDILLLVQSYIQIPNINNIFKKYFEQNPNGMIIMCNTVVIESLSPPLEFVKSSVLPIVFNNDSMKGQSLTIDKIEFLERQLNVSITNIKIASTAFIFDQYLTILRKKI